MKIFTTTLRRVGDIYANRNEPESFRALASMYWRVLLSLTIFFVLLAMSYGAWQFAAVFGTPKEEKSLVPAGAQANILDPKVLDATVQGFEDRSAHYLSLKINPPRVSDPSR